MQQHTILREGSFIGVALHSGGEVLVRILPAEADEGIVFSRSDTGNAIRANCNSVGDTNLATTLQENDTCVSMVEHLLSSLAASGLDNIKIVLDGAEVPILDGSSAPWLLFLNDCGRRELKAKKRDICVLKQVRVEGDNNCYAEFIPAEQPSYCVTIDYPHKYVNNTGVCYDFVLTPENYRDEISRARTFCYVNDVEIMHRHQRALGGSLKNAVVYNDNGIINTGGLRYPNEFVRHKVLDAVGDCYINGHLIVARYRANKPGHGINNLLMRALMDDSSAWEWREH